MNNEFEETLKQIADAESALNAQLEELRKKRHEMQEAENKRILELRQRGTLEINVDYFDRNSVYFKVPYREDMIALLRNTPGRRWMDTTKKNSVPIKEWSKFRLLASELPGAVFHFVEGMEKQLTEILNEPTWKITLYQRAIHVSPGHDASRWVVQHAIPEAIWNTQNEYYEVPIASGWKLLNLFGSDNVEWTEEVLDFIQRQIAQREQIDKIALLEEDPEYAALDLNGNKLMRFQTVGARFLEAANGRAIIADVMGLGKTWQFIAYVVKNNYRAVVVVPASLKRNWAREIYKLTGKRALILSGMIPKKSQIIKLLAIEEQSQFTIINYDILRKGLQDKDDVNDTLDYLWVELINKAAPDVIGIDEAHYIKNTDSHQSRAVRMLKADHIVPLTGTPLINRRNELWPLLYMIAPDQFPSFETFERQYSGYAGAKELREILKQFMIRRTKADVMKDLPVLNRIPRDLEISEKAYKLYQRVLDGIYEVLAELQPGQAGEQKIVQNILVQIGRLKQICAIDSVTDTADLAVQLYDQTDESEKRKVLIFTQYKAVAYAIWQRLADDGAISFVRREGSEFYTADADLRDELVQQFQRDPKIKYLVVTEKTTKEGHNITAAGHVIFNDLFWTPAGHDQAIGRAYGRLADCHGVDAYFQKVQLPEDEGKSIADWIWSLLAFKQGEIDLTVENIQADRQETSIQMQIVNALKEIAWTRKKK